MANRSSPQSPPLQDPVSNQMRIGIEILPEPDMPEPELTSSPVAGDDGSDNFLALSTELTWKLWMSELMLPTLRWAALASPLKNQRLQRTSVT